MRFRILPSAILIGVISLLFAEKADAYQKTGLHEPSGDEDGKEIGLGQYMLAGQSQYKPSVTDIGTGNRNGNDTADSLERESAGPGIGERFGFEGRLLYWNANFRGIVRSDEGDLKGTEIDIVEDLGLETPKGVVSAEFTIKFLERNKLKFSYINFSYSSSVLLTDEVVFKGVTYPLFSLVDTTADIVSIRAGYEFDIFHNDTGFFGVQLAANYLSSKITLVANKVLTNSVKSSVVIPVVAATGRVFITHNISGTLEGSWMSYDTAMSLDGSAYLDYNPMREVGLTLGWRTIIAEADLETEKAEIQWSGFYVGIVVRM